MSEQTSDSPQKAPWLQRSVTAKQIWMAAGLMAGVWLLILAASGTAFYHFANGHTTIEKQPLLLHLPDGMKADADFQTQIATMLDTSLDIKVPFRQSLHVGLPDTVNGIAHVQTSVPINTIVRHDMQVAIDTQIDTEIKLIRWLPSLSVHFPVHMRVPVRLVIPVKTQIPLPLKLQAKARLPEFVKVPIDTHFAVRVPLHQPLQISASSRTHFALNTPHHGIPVTLTQSKLQIPVSDFRLIDASAASPHPAGH